MRPEVLIRHEAERAIGFQRRCYGRVENLLCEADFSSWYLSQIIDVARPGARAHEKAPTNAMLAGIAAMRPATRLRRQRFTAPPPSKLCKG
jgi:hypothetical protein